MKTAFLIWLGVFCVSSVLFLLAGFLEMRLVMLITGSITSGSLYGVVARFIDLVEKWIKGGQNDG